MSLSQPASAGCKSYVGWAGRAALTSREREAGRVGELLPAALEPSADDGFVRTMFSHGRRDAEEWLR